MSDEKSLQAAFLEFCRFGDKSNDGRMDNVKFAKMAKGMACFEFINFDAAHMYKVHAMSVPRF